QVIVTLVHRYLVDPGQQGAAEIEIPNREVNLGEDLLRDVFRVVMIPKNAVDDRKDLGLIPLHDLAERHLIAGLDAPDKGRLVAMLVVHASSGWNRFGPRSCRRESKYFAQAAHATLPTQLLATRFQRVALKIADSCTIELARGHPASV